jgi:hypothetical protein
VLESADLSIRLASTIRRVSKCRLASQDLGNFRESFRKFAQQSPATGMSSTGMSSIHFISVLVVPTATAYQPCFISGTELQGIHILAPGIHPGKPNVQISIPESWTSRYLFQKSVLLESQIRVPDSQHHNATPGVPSYKTGRPGIQIGTGRSQ